MKTPTFVNVLAIPVENTPTAWRTNEYLHLHEDDRGVPGTYQLVIPDEVPSDCVANAALDYFHRITPVKQPEDFEFFVADQHTGCVINENKKVQSYSFRIPGDANLFFHKKSDGWSGIYSVRSSGTRDPNRILSGTGLTVASDNVSGALRIAELFRERDNLAKANTYNVSCLRDGQP